MDEGLITLIFILLFIISSVVDAVGRRKKRRRRMDEMEREEEGMPEARSSRRPSTRPPTSGAPPPDAWEAPGRGAGAGGHTGAGGHAGTDTRAGPSGEEVERQTADQMIPEDFWAILTGQTPPDREAPTEEREHAPYRPPGDFDAEGRRGDPEPPREPEIAFPSPVDRLPSPEEEARRREEAAREREAAAARPTRRSEAWMDGLERESKRQEAETVPSIEETVPSIEEGEQAVYAAPEEPWGELADISTGDLTEADAAGEPTTGLSGAPGAGRGRRRVHGAGSYTTTLRAGRVEDLRKAVVLREVLGAPVGFREDEGRW